MTITFKVCDHEQKKVIKQKTRNDYEEKAIASHLVGDNDHRIRCKNGFFSAVICAYNQHHELVLRPDDVWAAIISQFSLYIQSNEEKLRSKFVSFDDKKQLVVEGPGSIETADYAEFARNMSDEISKNLISDDIRDWIIPSFTTTTAHDKAVFSVMMMATMQKYFDYTFVTLCGLPQVTLLGEVSDWEDLEKRAKRITEFDSGDGLMLKWSEMLNPIFEHLTKSAKGNPDLDFWNKICSQKSRGSGSTYLTGWITVFCAFDKDSKWMGDKKRLPLMRFRNVHPEGEREEKLEWHFIDMDDIPMGALSTPVTLHDSGVKHEAVMFAGHSSMCITENYKGLRPSLEWKLVLKTEPKPKKRIRDLACTKEDDEF